MTETASDAAALLHRHVVHIGRVPEKLVGVTLMPVAYLTVIGLLFGSAIDVPGGRYIPFLMAGILAQTMLMNITSTAQGVYEDLHDGIVDRLRVLPVRPVVVLGARVGANTLLAAVSAVVIGAGGLALKWRPEGSPLELLGALMLLLLLAWVMSWVGACIGLVVRAGDAITSVAFLLVLPLTFLSNAFIPLDGLPLWLQQICQWNPISLVVTACRQLFGDLPATAASAALPVQHALPLAVVVLVGVAALAAPLALRAYAKAGVR